MSKAVLESVKVQTPKLEAHVKVELTVSLQSKALLDLFLQADSIANCDEIFVKKNGKLVPIEILDCSTLVERVYDNDEDECIYVGEE